MDQRVHRLTEATAAPNGSCRKPSTWSPAVWGSAVAAKAQGSGGLAAAWRALAASSHRLESSGQASQASAAEMRGRCSQDRAWAGAGPGGTGHTLEAVGRAAWKP
ncbi:unnamed protein product [Prorocentrum cordatum]|uniref:Uncharacterized protein n=1 Tax=Prorocentrum cordatum TaxID=2364126 RepID=A0ABN9RS70_9DINO|nr:unnamed protein product [Polarella glacialis]